VGVVTGFYFIMAAVALYESYEGHVMDSSVMREPKRKLDKKETGQLGEANDSVPDGRCSFPGWDRRFSLTHHTHATSMAHTATCAMGTAFPRG
jgi:hypothetical protein